MPGSIGSGKAFVLEMSVQQGVNGGQCGVSSGGSGCAQRGMQIAQPAPPGSVLKLSSAPSPACGRFGFSSDVEPKAGSAEMFVTLLQAQGAFLPLEASPLMPHPRTWSGQV